VKQTHQHLDTERLSYGSSTASAKIHASYG